MAATNPARSTVHLTAILESVPTAIVAVDHQGRIVLVNRQCEKLFGYTRGELVGEPIEVLVPLRFREHHPELRESYLEGPVERPMGAGRDLFGLRKDGTEFPIEIGLSPIQAEGGDAFVLAAVVDLTLRKMQADTLLRQANERLERSNLELSQFAYIASHDLQAPLRSVSGFSQLLERNYRDLLDERGRDWIGRVVNAAETMQRLIEDLLSYARLDSRPQPFRPVDLGEVLEEVSDLLESSLEELDGTLRYDRLPTVLGDRFQMVQVFQNLIGNAIKYHGERPPLIQIRAEEAGGAHVISVQDNGLGIEEEDRETIFEIFRRAHGHAYPGTGIGLAVTKRVVERHGGRVWVESEPGVGSTFSFTLPSTREAP